MIAQEFSSTGWQVHRPAAGITRYQVFGERSSGTNFIKRLIGRNTLLTPTEELGWKHGFPQMTAIPQDTLIVCVTRNAVDWASSMHAKPWHCPPEMQRLTFSDFIRAESGLKSASGRKGRSTRADAPSTFCSADQSTTPSMRSDDTKLVRSDDRPRCTT